VATHKQQLWNVQTASDKPGSTLGGQEMRFSRAFKLLYQLMTDREVYFLIGLAVRNLFRKPQVLPSEPESKKAKAVSAD
jgi:hypothetical protein